MPHLSGAHLIVEHRPQAVIVENLVSSGMKLIKVKIISLQSAQRVPKLLQNLFRRPSFRFFRWTDIAVAKLRRQNPVSSVSRDTLSNHSFDGVIAVTFRGVNEVNPQLASASEQLVNLGG